MTSGASSASIYVADAFTHFVSAATATCDSKFIKVLFWCCAYHTMWLLLCCWHISLMSPGTEPATMPRCTVKPSIPHLQLLREDKAMHACKAQDKRAHTEQSSP